MDAAADRLTSSGFCSCSSTGGWSRATRDELPALRAALDAAPQGLRPRALGPRAHALRDLFLTPTAGATDTPAVRRGTGLEIVVLLLIGWGVNIVALLVIDWMFDGVEIGRWGPVLLGAAVLGIANAILKPILALLTLPLILITFGLAYFAINVAMLALAEWIAPTSRSTASGRTSARRSSSGS